MKVTLAMVTSLDGKITEGDKPGAGSWASPEDQRVFLAQMKAHDCIVMGSATYLAARAGLKPNKNKLRIVLTRTPQKFAHQRQPGLEFSAAQPEEIIQQASNAGCESLLLLGGARTNARFFDAGLVDELLVTIEPLLFGAGTPFVTSLSRTARLQLVSCEQLNNQGTLLLRYLVHKRNKESIFHEDTKI